jgi:rRNA-processing protein FCF1
MTVRTKDAKKRTRIILDANALLVPAELKIDIFQKLGELLNRNFQLVLLTPIRRELEDIAGRGSPQMQKKALMALQLAEKCVLVSVRTKEGASPDDVILQTASRRKWPVFTNDRRLRKKLRDINVPVIYVRQKSRLEIDGRL